MRLLLIRHGDPDYEHDNLTETGKLEAQLLAERMLKTDINHYYVSTMGRAQATIAPTLKATGCTAEAFDWLREFNLPTRRPELHGGYGAVPWDWLPQDLDAEPILLDSFRWREQEYFMESGVGRKYDEVTGAFDMLLSSHGYKREGLFYRAETPNHKTIAFFCHFGLSCVLLSHLLNCSPMLLWQGLCMPPSSVTTVYTEERRPGLASFRAQSVGDISHLYTHGTAPSVSARFCEVHGDGGREDYNDEVAPELT
jgi:probable phosphoglycerate mutase